MDLIPDTLHKSSRAAVWMSAIDCTNQEAVVLTKNAFSKIGKVGRRQKHMETSASLLNEPPRPFVIAKI